MSALTTHRLAPASATTLQRLAETRAALVAAKEAYDAAGTAFANTTAGDMLTLHDVLMRATQHLERAQLEHSLAVSAHLLAVGQ